MINIDKVNSDDLKRFESEFQEVKDVIPEILRLKKEYEECNKQLGETSILKYNELLNSSEINPINSYNNFIKKLANNQIITLRAMYSIQEYKNRSNDDVNKKNDFLKECVLTMDALNNSYDKNIDRDECSRFLYNVKYSMLKLAFSLALNILK